MSVPATWDGKQYVSDPNGNREPVCEACARQLVARFEREQLPIPPAVLEPDYFERAQWLLDPSAIDMQASFKIFCDLLSQSLQPAPA